MEFGGSILQLLTLKLAMHVINGSSKLKSAGKKELKLTTNSTPEFKVKVAVRYAMKTAVVKLLESLAHQRDSSYVGNVAYLQILNETRS